jgi:hypothetical protein
MRRSVRKSSGKRLITNQDMREVTNKEVPI